MPTTPKNGCRAWPAQDCRSGTHGKGGKMLSSPVLIYHNLAANIISISKFFCGCCALRAQGYFITLFSHLGLDLARFRGTCARARRQYCSDIARTMTNARTHGTRTRAWDRRAKTPSKRMLAQAKAALRASRGKEEFRRRINASKTLHMVSPSWSAVPLKRVG